MPTDPPSSPSKSHKSTPLARVVPLESSVREQAIHPDLPEVKVPRGDLKPYQYHPVSCEALTAEDLQHHKLPQLQKQYPTSEAAAKARAEAIKEVQERMAEAEKKMVEIDQQRDEMEKTREIERRIYLKQGKHLPDAG